MQSPQYIETIRIKKFEIKKTHCCADYNSKQGSLLSHSVFPHSLNSAFDFPNVMELRELKHESELLGGNGFV